MATESWYLTSWAQLILLPIVANAVIVGLKVLSRNDPPDASRRAIGDLSVGIDLLVSALLILIGVTITQGSIQREIDKLGVGSAHKALGVRLEAVLDAALPGTALMIYVVLALVVVAVWIRFVGRNDAGDLRPWLGVALPNLFSILVLVGVMGTVGS